MWRNLLLAAAVAALAACASPPAVLPQAPADLQLMSERPERLIVVAVANPRSPGGVLAASTLGSYASMRQYVAGATARQTLERLKQAHGLRELTGWPIDALRLHCVVLEVAAGSARDDVIGALKRDPAVEIAQPLHTFGTFNDAAAGYNDPYAALQIGLAEVEAAKVHASARGRGISIALIDTGVDVSHPDLQGRIAAARNFVDRDEPAFKLDRHGTAVAGVIAAVANNRQGIVGIAPEATLRVYKACWQRPSGDAPARCNSFTLAQALAAGIDDGAVLFNLSLGGPADELLARLLGHAIAQGRIVVAAVPPGGALNGFPLGVPGVIGVDAGGALERRGVLRAPGRDILTLVPGGHYDFASGSSLAAAHVTGVVALLLAEQAPLAPAELRALLEDSRVPGLASGSISACKAMAGLRKTVSCAVRASDATKLANDTRTLR
jgi:hypothetical protein